MTACSWSPMRPLTLTVAGIRGKRNACAILAQGARHPPRTDDPRVGPGGHVGPPVSLRTAMRVLNSAQMREADRRTIEDIGIPSLVLMENAGRQVVAALESVYSDLGDRKVAVLCGRGNNGGDGFVVARTMAQRGVDVSVFLLGSVAD